MTIIRGHYLSREKAALKWVHSFVGLFGGDKNQVTVTGSSAGSASTFIHLGLIFETFANDESKIIIQPRNVFISDSALPSSWPYFKRAAPTGIGLQGMTKSPHKVQVSFSKICVIFRVLTIQRKENEF